MKHARDDYNRIQDPAGLIPEDEPVFLLRGQDKFAAEAVRYYAHLVQHQRNPDMKIVFASLRQAEAMDAWQNHKNPDMPARTGDDVSEAKVTVK